jgi:hypothetical protein
VTDTSTQGLLPQLTDVLRALTDSHVLLLSKIQTVRLEQISAAYPVVEMLGQTSEPPVDLRAQSVVDTTTSPVMEVPDAVQIYEVESSASSSGIESSEIETRPTPPVVAAHAADHMVMSQPPAPAEIATSQDNLVPSVSVPSPSPPLDQRKAEQADPTDAESENRNYNFFDDLDARLAGLGDAESAGDR